MEKANKRKKGLNECVATNQVASFLIRDFNLISRYEIEAIFKILTIKTNMNSKLGLLIRSKH